MKKLFKSTQLMISTSGVIFLLTLANYANAGAVENTSAKDTQVIQMVVSRAAHQSSALSNGQVLVSGGAVQNELLQPNLLTWVETGEPLSGPQMFASTLLLPSGKVLVIGDYDDRLEPSGSAWLVSNR